MLTFSSHWLLKVQGSGDLTLFTLTIFTLHSYLLTVCMLFDCVVIRLHTSEPIQSKFQKLFSLTFRCYSDYNQMKIRVNSGGFQMNFRWILGGYQMVFWGVSEDF